MKSFIYGSISALLACVDLYVKSFVEKEVPIGEEQEECGGRVLIRHVHNRGFALNQAEDYPKLIKCVSAGALASIAAFVLCVWKRSICVCEKLAASLVLAGGISNTYERFKKGYVVDYFGFKTKWEKFNRITFNLGDMFLFAGGIILILKDISKGKH